MEQNLSFTVIFLIWSGMFMLLALWQRLVWIQSNINIYNWCKSTYCLTAIKNIIKSLWEEW